MGEVQAGESCQPRFSPAATPDVPLPPRGVASPLSPLTQRGRGGLLVVRVSRGIHHPAWHHWRPLGVSPQSSGVSISTCSRIFLAPSCPALEQVLGDGIYPHASILGAAQSSGILGDFGCTFEPGGSFPSPLKVFSFQV